MFGNHLLFVRQLMVPLSRVTPVYLILPHSCYLGHHAMLLPTNWTKHCSDSLIHYYNLRQRKTKIKLKKLNHNILIWINGVNFCRYFFLSHSSYLYWVGFRWMILLCLVMMMPHYDNSSCRWCLVVMMLECCSKLNCSDGKIFGSCLWPCHDIEPQILLILNVNLIEVDSSQHSSCDNTAKLFKFTQMYIDKCICTFLFVMIVI